MDEKTITPMNNYCITLHKIKRNKISNQKDEVTKLTKTLSYYETNELLNKNEIFVIEDF